MIAHDLFLLMLNLFQIRERSHAISIFIESANDLFPGIEPEFVEPGEKWGKNYYELATLDYKFGAIVFGDGYEKLSEDQKFYLNNSCALLAIILEKIYHSNLLESDKEKLQSEAQAKESNLILSELKYKAVFDSSNDGFSLIDLNGKHIEINQAMVKMTGFSKKELIGTGIPHPYWAPESRKSILNELNKIKSGVTGNAIETVFLHKSGKKFPVVISPSTIKNQDGKIQYIFATIRDISDWKKIENDLRKSEEKFRKLYENIPIALFRSTPGGKILNVNQAFVDMYGFESKEEVYKMKAEDFYQSKKEREDILKKLLDSGEANHIVTKEKKKDGSTIWVKSNYKIYLNTDNPKKISYIDGVATDITDTKNYEKELNEYHGQLELRVKNRTREIENQTVKLRESQKALTFLLADVNESRKELENVIKELAEVNKELESFSYSVSHDLRAPLRAINGFTQILQEDYGTLFDDEGKRVLNIIINNVKSMTQLIDDLLAFTRIGRKVLAKNTIDSKELIQNIVAELTTILQKSPKIIVEENLPDLYGDLNLLKQVYINLISNAIKFSSGVPQPLIEVGGQKTSEYTEIWVQDNGIGFDNKYRDKIFEVFQRLHSVDEFEGAGVGLSIVNRIIEKHKGNILVEGNPGKGAKFTVRLPLKK